MSNNFAIVFFFLPHFPLFVVGVFLLFFFKGNQPAAHYCSTNLAGSLSIPVPVVHQVLFIAVPIGWLTVNTVPVPVVHQVLFICFILPIYIDTIRNVFANFCAQRFLRCENIKHR